ncbi:MAG: hypothetical protein P4L41_07995 [Flavipsychrobacter sp.]|nr:hypothetical protein [Flavipsychrobacter sp.]
MLLKNKKKSKLQRASWMFLAVFFVTFCSCPVKRLIRIEMGLPVPPLSVPVSSTGDHDANNIKDCNITKHEFSQKIVLAAPQQIPDFSLYPLALFNSYLSVATDLNIKSGELTRYNTRQDALGDIPILYLKQGRIQV